MQRPIVVNGSFLVKRVTGVQRYARESIKALSETGFQNLLIITPCQYPEDSYFGYPIKRDLSSFNWHNQWWLWEQFRLPSLYREVNGGLLWSPCNTGPVSIQNQLVSIHDTAVFSGPEWFSFPGRTYYRWLLPRLSRKAKHILTVSNFSKQEIIKHLNTPSDKVTVIYSGIGASLKRESTSTKCNSGKPYFLHVGSRDPKKNVKRLIEAWQRVGPELKKDVELRIVGGHNKGFGPEKLSQVDPDIVFLDYVDDAEMVKLYQNATAMVFPSLYEGFGFPPLEAMSFGMPVIVSNTGSLPEICGDTLYCNPLDPDDIAAKIGRVLSEPDLRDKLRIFGMKHSEKYSWTKSATNLCALFNQLTNSEQKKEDL